MKRTGIMAVAALLLALTWNVTAGDNLLPQGDFGNTGAPSKWELDKDWMSTRFSLQGTGSGAFVRINEAPAKMQVSVPVPQGLSKLALAARVRQTNFQKGDKGWDVPTMVVNFVTGDGKEVGSGWKKTIKFRGGTGWRIEKYVYKVPEGVAKAVVEVSYKGSGDFDIDWIQLYDPSNPPEMKEDAQ